MVYSYQARENRLKKIYTMGKNKWSRDVDHEDENIHPGCMWGFIHALGYHSWHSRVKRKSLPRINDGSSHIRSKSFFKDFFYVINVI